MMWHVHIRMYICTCAYILYIDIDAQFMCFIETTRDIVVWTLKILMAAKCFSLLDENVLNVQIYEKDSCEGTGARGTTDRFHQQVVLV